MVENNESIIQISVFCYDHRSLSSIIIYSLFDQLLLKIRHQWPKAILSTFGQQRSINKSCKIKEKSLLKSFVTVFY